MSRIFTIHQVNIGKFNDLLDEHHSAIRVTSISMAGSLAFISVDLNQGCSYGELYDFSRKALELRSA